MAAADELNFSFMDKVKWMMYGEQEKEAFLIEKKEKEEKKKGMRTRALSLHQQGWSWTKIATELGCHRTTVMRLVHKWQQTGCIGDLPHRRRNPPRPPGDRSSSPSKWCPRPGSEENNRPRAAPPPPSSPGARSTTVTVRRRLKELRSQLGIRPPPSSPTPPPHKRPPPPPAPSRDPPPPCPLREVAALRPEEMSRLLFSDMKVLLCDAGGGVRVWRLGQPPLDSPQGLRSFFGAGGLSATFWVCVSGSGRKGLMLHIPDELTEERYVQILHNGLLPSAAAIYGLDAHRFLFAQDKGSIQGSPAVEDFLRQQQIRCAEWPATSSDLNPCDLLWPEVEAVAADTTRLPSSVPELVSCVRAAYEAVDEAFVQWLVAPVRIRSLCRRMASANRNDDES